MVLGSNKKVTFDGRGGCNVNILSNRIVDSLMRYGLVPNKSLHTVFPKNIQRDMYRHMIRGLIDGDGSVGFYSRPNRKVHRKILRLCQGNEQFLIDVANFLSDELHVRNSPTSWGAHVWSISYNRNEDLIKLYDYLYKDATIYLKRKKDIYDKVVNEIRFYQGNTEITTV